MPTETIAVIGAGVIGLSTARLLQKRFPMPKTQIIIIAAELPTTTTPSADYASAWAGAHYRPIPRSTPQLDDEARMAMHTAETMRQIARGNPEAGVAEMKGVEYLEAPEDFVWALKTGMKEGYAWPGDNFRVLDKNELPKGVKWGCEYDTYCVNVALYCRWLLSRFQADGGRVVNHSLRNSEEAFEVVGRLLNVGEVSKVVNCSGRNFDHDPNTKVIRGQTVLVRQQYHQTITRQCADGSWAFLIPRPGGGGTIVGGSKEIDDYETKQRPETRSTLLEQAVRYFPDFVDDTRDFNVVKNNVGRRPWRQGGLRLETEPTTAGMVIHGYGAGGRGYELSWGAAARIVDAVISSSKVKSSL
jgi:D-amino-acid oxidase